ILNIGAVPILAEPLTDSFFNNYSNFIEKITAKTKAILFYHPFGHFDPAIFEVAKYNIPVIEDITHSWGAQSEMGVKCGESSSITISSLGSTKFITSGTGGIISTNNTDIASKIEILLDYDFKLHGSLPGAERYNLQLGDLNASMLIGQMKVLDQ